MTALLAFTPMQRGALAAFAAFLIGSFILAIVVGKCIGAADREFSDLDDQPGADITSLKASGSDR